MLDLNHDGRPDGDGAAAVESMITNRGGTLCAELTALTDFVVLGGPPRRPRTSVAASAEHAQRLNTMQQVYEQYIETVASAKSLSVPILTQQVFLNFLGYSGRYAIR